MFYALHIHEMRKLFQSDQPIVKQIREVVQLLLTDAFNDAKHWLTEICTLPPDSNNIINSLGTDKNITLCHIRKYISETV